MYPDIPKQLSVSCYHLKKQSTNGTLHSSSSRFLPPTPTPTYLSNTIPVNGAFVIFIYENKLDAIQVDKNALDL